MSAERAYTGEPTFDSAISVDNVIFAFGGRSLRVLLIQRSIAPYLGNWALPGDMVVPDEDLDSAAERVLRELTGLEDVYLEQVASLATPGRHPRGRVITVAYYSLVRERSHPVQPQGWAQQARYFDIDELPPLAFDHEVILGECRERLRERVRTRPLGFELLPSTFSLSSLQSLYESILGHELDKRNFRKKILAMGVVESTGKLQENVSHRPAQLYRFNRGEYDRMREEGFSFAV